MALNTWPQLRIWLVMPSLYRSKPFWRPTGTDGATWAGAGILTEIFYSWFSSFFPSQSNLKD